MLEVLVLINLIPMITSHISQRVLPIKPTMSYIETLERLLQINQPEPIDRYALRIPGKLFPIFLFLFPLLTNLKNTLVKHRRISK